jgi:hypothetical protein
MTNWVKIDRATGDIIKRKRADSMTRIFNKPSVWLEQVNEAKPAYDPDTHKLEALITQPDMSDLSVDVDPSAQRVEGWSTVAMSADELQDIVNGKIAQTDRFLARMVEDILVHVAQGTPLTRNAFHPKVWDRINARRALRGKAPV